MGQGATFEQVKAEGVCGSLVDGVITFPVKSLLCTLESKDGFYYGNVNGAFKVVLPEAVATVQAQATTKSVKTFGIQPTGKRTFSPGKKSFLKRLEIRYCDFSKFSKPITGASTNRSCSMSSRGK